MLLNFRTFLQSQIFLYIWNFSCKWHFSLKTQKTLWKHILYDTILIFQQVFWINRSSRSEMFFKIDILKNFAIITGKHLCWSPFLIKLHTWRSAALLNRDSHRCFHVDFSKCLRTAFFIKHLRWLLLSKVKTNVESAWFIYYVIKSIMTLNSKL